MKRIHLILTAAVISAFIVSCSKSEDNDPQTETPGPKFLAAKAVISSSCATSGCHASPANAGGINFETNSAIAAKAADIKTLAVDLGTMPPTGALSAADKTKITDWVAAGGRITD